MNPPSLPWISAESIESFLSSIWRFFSNTILFATGTNAPLFTLFGMPIRIFDIILILLVVSLIALKHFLVEKIGVIEADRQALIDSRYLKPAPIEIKHSRWDTVTLLIRSNNENDWKQAIIDCDVMLDQLLSQLGYHGETLGEKLKLCTKQNFPDLEAAWNAHKVRNQIAHPTTGFKLDQREALTVYYLYEKVFRNSGFIV